MLRVTKGKRARTLLQLGGGTSAATMNAVLSLVLTHASCHDDWQRAQAHGHQDEGLPHCAGLFARKLKVIDSKVFSVVQLCKTAE